MNLLTDREKIREICEQNGINFLALFGSFSRGEAGRESDIDLLVEFIDPNTSLFKHVAVEANLEKEFGIKVDLVTRRSLHPYLRDHILKDLKVLYEGR